MGPDAPMVHLESPNLASKDCYICILGEKNESPIANGRNPFAVFNKLQKFRQFASLILIFEQCGKKKHRNFAQFYISARKDILTMRRI